MRGTGCRGREGEKDGEKEGERDKGGGGKGSEEKWDLLYLHESSSLGVSLAVQMKSRKDNT